ncbi:MAG: hypothetical protein IIC06_08610 [Proteobacteria bacterium]|nr:hypothetical protein [Pseudomonadota bacterium]
MTGRLASAPVLGLLAVLAAGILAAACTVPAGWKNPGATKEYRGGGQENCRRWARKEAERRYRESGSEVGSPVYGTDSTLKRNMARFEAVRNEKRLYQNCMKRPDSGKAKAAPEK